MAVEEEKEYSLEGGLGEGGEEEVVRGLEGEEARGLEENIGFKGYVSRF